MKFSELLKKTKDKKSQSNPSPWHIVTVCTFFAVLIILLVSSIIAKDKLFSQAENRSLEQRPEIRASAVANGSFMSRFEKYMSDQFPLRNTAVYFKSVIQRAVGNTESNNVYIGKDGWQFENQTPYDEEKVKKTTSAISDFSARCGIKNQVFMLVPDSTLLLENKLPFLLSFDSQAQQINDVYNSVSGEMKKIDTVKMFEGVQDKESLYYKTDHHWTTRAAKTAFDFAAPELGIDASKTEFEFHTLSNSFYGTLASSSGIYTEPDKIEVCIPKNSKGQYVVSNADTQSKSPSLFDLSKLEQSNQYEVFAGGNFSRLTISTTTLNNKNLLIFKDSYANCFIPMLTPFYEHIVVIDARYFTDDINAVLSDYQFTDLLFLYNVNTFLEDTSLKDIL